MNATGIQVSDQQLSVNMVIQVSNKQSSVNMVFASMRGISFLTSLINTLVFLNPKLKSSIYKFLCIMSASDTLYAFLLLSLGFTSYVLFLIDPECLTLTCYCYTYVAIWINEYVTTSLAMFSIALECYLTLQRILVLTQSDSSNRMINSRWIGFVILIAMFILHSPLLLLFESKMVPFGPNDHRILNKNININFTIGYDIVKTPFGHSVWGELVIKGLSLIRILLVSVVLLALNICAIVRFKRFFLRKESLTITKKRNNRTPSQEQDSRSLRRNREGISLTKMLIIVSFSYILGNLPHSVHFVYRMIIGQRIPGLLLMSQILMNASLSIKLVIYYLFNPPYRKTLNSLMTLSFGHDKVPVSSQSR